jgi:hypothetical protein
LLEFARRGIVQLFSDIGDTTGHCIHNTNGDRLRDECGSSAKIQPAYSSVGFCRCSVLLWFQEAATVADASAVGGERGWPESAQRMREWGIGFWWRWRRWWFSSGHVDRHRDRYVGIAGALNHFHADS